MWGDIPVWWKGGNVFNPRTDIPLDDTLATPAPPMHTHAHIHALVPARTDFATPATSRTHTLPHTHLPPCLAYPPPTLLRVLQQLACVPDVGADATMVGAVQRHELGHHATLVSVCVAGGRPGGKQVGLPQGDQGRQQGALLGGGEVGKGRRGEVSKGTGT